MDEDNVALMINCNTGEVIDKFKEGDSYKKITKETQEYNELVINKFNKDRHFVKIYDGVVPLLDKLSGAETKLMLKLIPYICYDDGILRNNGIKNGKILNCKELAEIINMDYSSVRKQMSSLIKHGVVAKCEVGSILKDENIKNRIVYLVNPYIFFRGNNLFKTVQSIFKDSGWNVD